MQSSKTFGAAINKSNIHLLQISRNLPQISNICAENLKTRNQLDHLDTFVYHSLARCIRNFICAECRLKSKDIYPKQPKSYPINKPTFLVSSSITRNAKLFQKFPAFAPFVKTTLPQIFRRHFQLHHNDHSSCKPT